MRGSGTVIIPDTFKTFNEKEVKKEAEETPTLWSPTAPSATFPNGKRFVVVSAVLSFNSTAGYWKFFDEGTEIFGMNVKAVAATEAPVTLFNFSPVGYESLVGGNKLILKASATSAKVSLVVYGIETT